MSTMSYSVLINGEPTKTLTPQRGIRQGDQFCLICISSAHKHCQDSLKRESKKVGFMDTKLQEEVQLSLTCFFFCDSFVFSRATGHESQTLMDTLTIYQKFSGHECFYGKSAITSSKGTP